MATSNRSGLVNANHSKVSFLRNDPVAVATAQKLVPARNRQRGGSGGGPLGLHVPTEGLLHRIGQTTATNINDTANVFEMLPDTQMAMEVMVASVLSPNDLRSVELTYTVSDYETKNPELTAKLIQVVEKHMTKHYNIKNDLEAILEDILFKKGSYPILIIPESSVDQVINGYQRVSMESLAEEFTERGEAIGYGLLGSNKKEDRKLQGTAMESIFGTGDTPKQDIDPKISSDVNLLVTDNPNVLKLPAIQKKAIKQRIGDIVRQRHVGTMGRQAQQRAGVNTPALEANTNTELTESETRRLYESLYKERENVTSPMVVVPTADENSRPTIGHPLVIKLPAECVIPVHVPGDKTDHVGYFVLLDQDGNPLQNTEDSDYYQQLSDRVSSLQQQYQNVSGSTAGASMSGALMQQTVSSFGGTTVGNIETQQLLSAYTSIVERDLVTRLMNGVYGKTLSVGRNNEVYRIMLSRSLANMQTRVLYIPSELMTYMAFDFNKYGAGKSLLDNSKVLSSLRSIMLISRTMSQVKNSIPRVQTNIALEEDDPDPVSTVEQILHNWSMVNQSAFPLGTNSPNDITASLERAGVQVNVSGNAGYPSVGVEHSQTSTNYTVPDGDLEESLRRRHLLSMGLVPEMIDASMSVDFATTAVASNLLFSKRVLGYQKLLCKFLQEFTRKYTLNSGALLDELRECVRDNKKLMKAVTAKGEKRQAVIDRAEQSAVEMVIAEFINGIELTLPQPDTNKLENQTTSFEMYSRALDTALPAYFPPEVLSNILGAEGVAETDAIDRFMSSIKSYFQRLWLVRNGMLTELESLTDTSTNNVASFEMLSASNAHVENMMKTCGGFVEKMLEISKGLNKEQAKRDEAANPTEPTETDPVITETNQEEAQAQTQDNAELDADQTAQRTEDAGTVNDADNPDADDNDFNEPLL